MDENHKQYLHRVMITGLGVVSPLGCSVTDFWTELLQGRSGVRTITNFDTAKCRTRIGAEVIDYDARRHFSRKETQRLSRSSQLAILAATEALEDSGLNLTAAESSKMGVIIGSSIGGFTASEPFFRTYFDDGSASPLIIPVVMNSAPASNLSIRFGFKGPLMNIDAACASSAHAIGYSFHQIKFGLLEAAVTGGADSALSQGVMHAWSSLRTLSERNEDPARACRPFSLDRDGMVLGEGAGILVLESERSALNRKAKIYGEITGYAAASDSYHLTKPSEPGLAGVMRDALASASLLPNDIDYIAAHATATLWNDKTETAAIKDVFGPSAVEIPVVGIKGAIGHSIGASSALQLISCVLSLRDNLLPPTINVNIPDPECDLDYVTEGKRPRNVTHAMSNSFAFGGSNASLVVSRYLSHLSSGN